MIRRGIDSLRWLRIRALMARGLSNWREVSAAYACGAMPPPLRLRTGAVIHHAPGDSPSFFEIFAGCYRRRLRPIREGVIAIPARTSHVLDRLRCVRHARIHAYEPKPGTFRRRRNIAQTLDIAFAYNDAVGRRPGVLQFAATASRQAHIPRCRRRTAATIAPGRSGDRDSAGGRARERA